MSEIKAEKGVPLPPSGYKYPWADLEVGDSFFVPGANTKLVAGSSQHASRKFNAKYIMRTVDGGVRVWRTE